MNIKMRIAVDKGPLTSGHRVRGIGTYTRELIKALKRLRYKDIRIFDVDFNKTDLTKYDLVHYPFFDPHSITLPFSKPAKIIVTIHDLIPLIYPKNYPPGLRGSFRFFIQKYLVKNVDRVITVSETSKKDIVRFLGVPAEKIDVIYEAPRRIFKQITNHQSPITTKRKYNLPNRFVLYVGDINYNKNILGLIKTCRIAKVPLVIVGKQALEMEEEGVGLDVLAGPKDWLRFLFNVPHPELAHYKKLLDELGKGQKIVRTGFVPDEDLVAICNLATVYCQPSFYEGFGLPVLEAMACGTPVAASKTQALVEIAEGAALFADPKDIKVMASNISKLLKSPEARADLIRKGKKRASEFSWKKTAKETIQVYKKVGGNEQKRD
jgi:glycosyltransferase involved in cell wall biosynthesis